MYNNSLVAINLTVKVTSTKQAEALGQEIAELYKLKCEVEAKKADMLKGAKETIKKVTDEFAPKLNALEKTIAHAKGLLLEYRKNLTPLEDLTIKSTTMVNRKALQVDDAHKLAASLDKEFLKEILADSAKLSKAVLAGLVVEGASIIEKPHIAVSTRHNSTTFDDEL